MARTIALSFAAAVCTLAGTTYAGIDSPPPWSDWGVTGGRAHWHWDFSDPSAPPTGQGPGAPQLVLTGGASFGSGPGGFGIIVPGGGSIDILVPNYNVPEHIKLIWVQTDYVGGPEPVISADFGPFTGSPWGPTFTPSPSPDGVGHISSSGWQLPFCPPFEVVHITNPAPGTTTFIRWITIDTLCVPSPAAVAAFGIGTLTASRRRKR